MVFRRPQDAGGVLGEVLAAYGIPVAWSWASRWPARPAAVALLRLLRLQADDWPLEALLALLGSNYFAPDWPEWLGGPGPRGGRSGDSPLADSRGPAASCWSDCDRRPSTATRRQRGQSHVPSERKSGQSAAAAVLGRLAAALDELPERATLAAWGKAWQRLARQTGLLERSKRRRPRRSGRLGLPASGLAGKRRPGPLARPRGGRVGPPRRWRPCWTSWPACGCRPAGDDGGRVRILSAASVRGLRVPYVFLAGLGEKSFPSPEREDRLYSEAEYQRLIDAGCRWSHAGRAEQRRDAAVLRGRHAGRRGGCG